MVSASIQCILWFASLHLLAFISMFNGNECKGRMGNGKGATVFEWLNCPICQNKQPAILSNDFLLWTLSRKILQPLLEWGRHLTLILAGVSDFETVAEDPCCDDVVTIRPTHVHGCHHHPLPSLQCHPMPWERLINICIKVILIPS